jgi:hypothetical protein
MGRLRAADAANIDAHRGVKRGMAGRREGGVVEVGKREAAKQTWGFSLSLLPRFDVPSAKAVLVPIW